MRWLIAVLLVSTAFAATATEEPTAPDLSTKSNAELVVLLRSYKNGGLEHACTEALPLMEELARRVPDAVPTLRGRAAARMYCAEQNGDFARALSYLSELEEKYEAADLDGYALYLAARTNDGQLALSRLRKLSRDDKLGTIDKELVFAAIRAVRRTDKIDDLGHLGLEIAKSDGFSALDRDVQATFAAAAVRSAAMSGDLADVEKLLPLLNSPSSYVDMLKWREYEKAWPVIERTAGDHLIKVGADYVSENRARLAEKPTDRDRFGDLARALYYNGEFAETEKLVGGWRQAQANLDQIEEGDAWAMNIEAYALDALGRRAEADAVFDRLAVYDPDKFSWVVNFAINRASRLVGQGRTEEGLAATVRAREVAEKQGSPYAKALVARDRACALIRLDRPADAVPELQFLRENSKENIEAATEGLLCAHKDDEAAALLSNAFDDKALRYQALGDFPGPQFELFYTPSDLPHIGEFIMARPDLREKALRLVRNIPDRFVPQAQLKRKELAGA